MENDKSPGIDGIPIEFYKTFYETLENDLIQLYNNILSTKKKYYKHHATGYYYAYPKKGDLNKLK